ncbi:hypothetical protein BIW11_12889 [Tropilaelaps mercedesae]|uniref:Axin-1-like n=1 Tax=Tropilaelaps mercedesae TaxID=418985 RepID=A0A1V9X504_9ACAR|nr:hypothetical protein BIW11_12889 [Tropilaelaps mercedesae]
MKEMVSQGATAMHAASHDPPVAATPGRKLLPAEPPQSKTASGGPLTAPGSDQHQQLHQYPQDEPRTSLQPQSSAAQSSCLQWARDLQTLLNDDAGCELFEHYLRQENCDESDLMFVYACNGLRVQEEQQDRDKQARAIFKRYVKTGLVQISSDAKDTLAAKIRNKDQPLEPDIFDVARKQVEDYIMRTTFARFIQSELYIDYVQRYGSGGEAPAAKATDDDADYDGDYLDLEDLDDEHDRSGLVSFPSDSEDDPDRAEFANNRPLSMLHVSLNSSNTVNNNNSKQSTTTTSNNNNNNNNDSSNHNNNMNSISKDKSDALAPGQQQSLMPTLPEHEEVLENATFEPPATLARKPMIPLMPTLSYGRVIPSDHGPPPPLPPQSKTVQRQKRQAQLGMSYGESMLRSGGHRPPPNPYHVKSSAFVPPTAYNSDIQSMSSGGNGNYDLDVVDCDVAIPMAGSCRSEQLPRSSHRRPGRAWPICEPVRDPMRDSVIPRTKFPNAPQGNPAEKNPAEFHQKLCVKLMKVLQEREASGGIEDEMHSQSILDDHVNRVFKSPAARTPRSPSPGSGPSRAVCGTSRGSASLGKTAFQQSTRMTSRRFVGGNPKESVDSAFYGIVTSASSGSGAVPRVQPRGKGVTLSLVKGPLSDATFDDNTGLGYNAQDNVREWINRPGADAGGPSSKMKASKTSICSGSNRSSCRKGTSSASNGPSFASYEIAIIYTYEGESVPYYIKLAQRQVRLRDFKAQLTKKGNFRYFFKRPMDEFSPQGVFEEIKDEGAMLPFWEGKIVAQIVQMPQEQE